MLANSPDASAQSGHLNKDVHLPATSRHELLDFIAAELPQWRDDPQRPKNQSETALTEYLCDHLNSAARMSSGWDILQFRTEIGDEQRKGRKIDLAPKPCGVNIWINGRCHTQYEALLPIECKRLPTPKEKDRDEREYVFNQYASTSGIQRFKAGNHGGNHKLGAMIAYVQEGTTVLWHKNVVRWIKGLISSGQAGWSVKDLLHLESDDKLQRVAIFSSSHTRENKRPEIELRHLWVEMN